jgi:hypothetical protein
MAKDHDKDDRHRNIVANRKFAVDVSDPKDGRRDNIRVTLHSDDGQSVSHHLRSYEIIRLVRALEAALEFGPDIPDV